jgi:D-mannonate dehydratase
MVRPSLILPPEPDERWDLARQLGVTDAVVHPLEVGDGKTDWSYEDLLGIKNWLEDAGLSFTVLEGSVPLTDRIRLGREGRDGDIEVFEQFVRNCGRLNIPVVCYDWIAGVRLGLHPADPPRDEVRGVSRIATSVENYDRILDMQAAMDAFVDTGFDGPMRPDHVPTMAGEDNSNPGYHTRGRLFAIGYMRGLLESAGEAA